MTTGDKRTYFEDKRNLPQNRIKDTFFDYLLLRLQEISSRVWGSERGVFGSLTIVSGGNDAFTIQTLPKDLLDGDGNILNLSGTDGTTIKFENTNTTDYYVAARHNTIPSGVLRNQRNNVIFYDTDEDRIGEKAEPIAVTEISGTLEIEVDSIFESTVSHAGRLVTVWLKRPVTTDESVAIERNLTVVYSGGINKVVTTGLLGQASGSASTNIADYQVFAQGVTVRKTDLRSTSPYAFIGIVTGGGSGNPPSAFSVIDQVDVSNGINPDLQEAYTAGNTITPSVTYGGAVKIQSSDSGDEFNSLLRLNRKGATEVLPVGLANVIDSDGVGQLNLVPISYTTVLQEDESGDSNATVGTIDLTRGGVNLIIGNVRRNCDLVLLSGFATSDMNGLYKLNSNPTSNQITIARLDGGSMAGYWSSGESGNISFLRNIVSIASTDESTAPAKEFGRGISLNGSNESDKQPPLRIFPQESRNSVEIYEGGVASPRLQTIVNNAGTIEIQTTGTPGSIKNELLKLSRLDNTDYAQLMFLAEMGNISSVPIACIQPLDNSTYLNKTEACTLGGSIITLTRGGVDLTQKDARINKDLNLVLVYDAADESDNGLYAFSAHTTNTVTVSFKLGGGSTFFSGASASCRIMQPRFVVGNSNPFNSSDGDWWGSSMLVTLMDGDGNAANIKIYTENKGKIQLYDGGKSNATTYKDPRELIVIDPTVIGDNNAHPIKIKRPVIIKGGNTGGGDEEDSHYRDGIRIYNAGGGFDTRDPAFPFAVDYGYPESLPSLHTWPVLSVDDLGGLNRGHNFRDDFMCYDPATAWTNVYPQPPFYKTTFVGSGQIIPRDLSNGAAYGHGCVSLITGSTTDDSSELAINTLPCNLDTGKDFRWCFRGRLKTLFTASDQIVTFGFMKATGSNIYQFKLNSSGVWLFEYWDGSTLQTSSTTCNHYADEYVWFEIYLGPNYVDFKLDRKDHASGYYMSGSETIASLNGASGGIGIGCKIKTTSNVARTCVLDYWEFWDLEVLYGRLGNSHNLNHP